MKFMLDCGFNLLIYGYGSKRDAINFFHQNHLLEEETIIFNGYHTACNMKIIVEKITSWFLKYVYHDQVEKKNIFPKNVAMHE
jgi:origin recognition complex subunit 2